MARVLVAAAASWDVSAAAAAAVAHARPECPRGSARNDATSVPLDEAYAARSSVMFVLWVCAEHTCNDSTGGEAFFSAFCSPMDGCMHGRRAGPPACENN